MARVRHVLRVIPGSYQLSVSETGTAIDTSSANIGSSRTALYSLDWSFTTGQSTAALTQNGRASGIRAVGASPQILTVVPSPTPFANLGMANVLQVLHSAVNDGYWVEIDNKYSAPAVGQSIWKRFYVGCWVPDLAGTQGYAASHPYETEAGEVGLGANTIAIKAGSRGNGKWPFLLQVESASFPFSSWSLGAPNNGEDFNPAELNKFDAYRIEYQQLRTSSTQFTLDMRVYDGNNVLRFDKNNIFAWTGTLAQTLAANGIGLPMDAAHYNKDRFGKNGGYGAGAGAFMYWGGFAVCNDTWCGPYIPGAF